MRRVEVSAGLSTRATNTDSTLADTTVTKLRNLSMLLRPPQLDALGLEAALRACIACMKNALIAEPGEAGR